MNNPSIVKEIVAIDGCDRVIVDKHLDGVKLTFSCTPFRGPIQLSRKECLALVDAIRSKLNPAPSDYPFKIYRLPISTSITGTGPSNSLTGTPSA